MRRRIHAYEHGNCVFYTLAYIYEEEDTCHMRRRIHAYEHGSFVFYTLAYIYEEEDTCHMRRRIHACTPLSCHIQAHTHKIPWPWLPQRPFVLPPPPSPPLQQQRPFALPPPIMYTYVFIIIYIYIYIQIMNEALVSVRSTDIRG